MLFAIRKATEKFQFKLYGLCIMSNHVHYLLEPAHPEDLPKIMHWLNWYTAMCFNRILQRTGHFWEQRYHSSGFERTDYARGLNTLRYIHANPKSANMQQGFFYDFSNYGIYDRLANDGITEWHPAFMKLGEDLEDCAEKYRGFCRHYKLRPKPEKRRRWGSKVLNGMAQKMRSAKAQKKSSPDQMKLPWLDWYQVLDIPEVKEIVEKFISANSWKPFQL